MDINIGRMMAALDRLDVADNTYVFCTSDNGPHNHSHLPFSSRTINKRQAIPIPNTR